MYQLFSSPMGNPASERRYAPMADVLCKNLLNMVRFLDEYARFVLEEFIVSLELGVSRESGGESFPERMSVQKISDDPEAVSERCRGVPARHLKRL